MEPAAPEPLTLPSPDVAYWRPLLGKGLRWLAFVAGIAPFIILMIGGGILGLPRPQAWPDIAAGLLWTAFVSGIGSLAFIRPRTKKAARVQAQATGIEVTYDNGKVRHVAHSEVRQAAIVADPLIPGLALDLSRGRALFVRTRSIEEAQRLLAAIGPAAKKARYRMQARASALGAAAGCLSIGAVFGVSAALFNLIKQGLSGFTGGMMWVGAVAAILFLFYAVTSRPNVEVGAEGVVIRELLRTRFIAFRDLESIRAEDKRVELRFTGGRIERIQLSQVSREQVAALEDRLSRAHSAARGEDGGARASLLARAGRPLPAWRAHLSELLTRGEGYREAALTPGEAEAVLAAGDATPEHRLGAALALVAGDREQARERIRIAADGCANPQLRVALSDLANGNLEDAAALEALGEESEQRTAPAAAMPRA